MPDAPVKIKPQFSKTFSLRSQDSLLRHAFAKGNSRVRARVDNYLTAQRKERQATLDAHKKLNDARKDSFKKKVVQPLKNIQRFNGVFREDDGVVVTYRGGQLVSREWPGSRILYYENDILVSRLDHTGTLLYFTDGVVTGATYKDGTHDTFVKGVLSTRLYSDEVLVTYRDDQISEFKLPNGLVEHWKNNTIQDRVLPDGTAYLFSEGFLDHVDHPDGSVTNFEGLSRYTVTRSNGDVETYSEGKLSTVSYSNTGIVFSFEDGNLAGKTYPNGTTETWENGEIATRTLPDGTVEIWKDWEVVSSTPTPKHNLIEEDVISLFEGDRVEGDQIEPIEEFTAEFDSFALPWDEDMDRVNKRSRYEMDIWGGTHDVMTEAEAEAALERVRANARAQDERDQLLAESISVDQSSDLAGVPEETPPSAPTLVRADGDGLVATQAQPSLSALQSDVRRLGKSMKMASDSVGLAEADLLAEMCRERKLLSQLQAEHPTGHPYIASVTESLSVHEEQYAALVKQIHDPSLVAHVIRTSQLAHANDEEKLTEAIAQLAARKEELFQFAYSEPHPWVAEIEDSGEEGLLLVAEHRQKWNVHDENDPYGEYTINEEQEAERAALQEMVREASKQLVGGLSR